MRQSVYAAPGTEDEKTINEAKKVASEKRWSFSNIVVEALKFYMKNKKR